MGNLGCALLVAQPLSSLSHLGRRAEIEERSFARCRGLRMTNRRENTAKTLRCALCSLGAATLLAVLSTLHLLHTSTTPVGWLRLGSRTQSSLRRSRRFVSWSSPCHPQGFFAGVTPEPGCPTRGTGRENPGRESLKKEHSEESLCHESGESHTASRQHARADHSILQKPAPTSAHHS